MANFGQRYLYETVCHLLSSGLEPVHKLTPMNQYVGVNLYFFENI